MDGWMEGGREGRTDGGRESEGGRERGGGAGGPDWLPCQMCVFACVVCLFVCCVLFVYICKKRDTYTERDLHKERHL